MDITMCCIDTKNNEIQLACANHSPYIVTDSKIDAIEGDIYSIGGMFATRPDIQFTNHVIKCTEPTWIYMFSDGYQDQFGGERNKKFMETRLRNMLYDNHNKRMHEQLDVVERRFANWKGDDGHQTDDVLLIGMHIDV